MVLYVFVKQYGGAIGFRSLYFLSLVPPSFPFLLPELGYCSLTNTAGIVLFYSATRFRPYHLTSTSALGILSCS
jgi:hypothetical protein